MRAICWLALKDLRLLWRDRWAMFWVLAFPLMYALLFGSIFGGGGNRAAMTVAVVDEDRSEASTALATQLGTSSGVKIVSGLALAAARDQVRRGDLVAFLRIPKGYGASAGSIFGGQASLELGIDPSRTAESGMLKGLITQAYFLELRRGFTDPKRLKTTIGSGRLAMGRAPWATEEQRKAFKTFFDKLDEALETPAGGDGDSGGGGPGFGQLELAVEAVGRDVDGRPRSMWEIVFPAAVLWGLISCASSFAVSLVVERVHGTLLRLRLAPISGLQVLTGKGLACFLACQMTLAILLGVGVVGFGVRIRQPAGLAMAALATSLCFVGLMLLLSVLGRTEQAVAGSSMAVLMVMAMIGGAMIPLIAMPQWMLNVSHASPVKWSIIALEGAIWRDFSLTELAGPCAILIGVGAAALTLALVILRQRNG